MSTSAPRGCMAGSELRIAFSTSLLPSERPYQAKGSVFISHVGEVCVEHFCKPYSPSFGFSPRLHILFCITVLDDGNVFCVTVFLDDRNRPVNPVKAVTFSTFNGMNGFNGFQPAG